MPYSINRLDIYANPNASLLVVVTDAVFVCCYPLQNPKERLGCHPQTGFQDITSHAFYKSIEWDHVSSFKHKIDVIQL